MNRLIVELRQLLSPDSQADRVVPPTGFTVQLTLLTSAAMAFLAVFALALSLAAGRLADQWGDQLSQSSTVRISAPAGALEAQTEAVLRVLRETPGVAEARALTNEEQRALLEPWFGPDLPVETLAIPQLIDVVETGAGYDAAGLRLRLAAEAPGAVLDDHTRWRRPLVAAASRLNLFGWVSILLIAATVGAMVTLAANAALSANAQVISVLRLVGATDDYIAGAFVRRYTVRALSGAVAGATLGIVAVLLLPQTSETGGFLTGLGFRGWHWILPFLIPLLSATVAYFATRTAARRVLEGLA